MQKLKQLNALKNACLNIADLIELEYDSIRFQEDYELENSKVNYDLLREKLSKFSTLVKDFSIMNKLTNDVEYFKLSNDPNVYLEYK